VSFRDRPYAGDESGAGGMGQLGRQIGLPRPTPVTLALIGANALVMVLMLSLGQDVLREGLGLPSGRGALHVWRFVTFQFVHGGARHFLWNMLGLYFFGPPLEARFGRWRFLAFYLVCGIGAGLLFQVIASVWAGAGAAVLIGASGGILGCVMGCAILFPEMIVLIFPIRWVAAFYFVMYVLSITWDKRLADAAHLGGMITAALWVWGSRSAITLPGPRTLGKRIRRGLWQRRLRERDKLQHEIDRILQKIHTDGLNSLSGREKRLLKKATEVQREEERRIRRL
jgi:membrane associated rhomboid family serine protease